MGDVRKGIRRKRGRINVPRRNADILKSLIKYLKRVIAKVCPAAIVVGELALVLGDVKDD